MHYKKLFRAGMMILVVAVAASCAKKVADIRFTAWDPSHMAQVKTGLKHTDSPYYPAFEKLLSDAGAELERGPYSVTYKKVVPPGGSRHDYMSIGPYWWPDPEKPDGLPYIRRDGVRNPENGIDRSQLGSMITGTRSLALAWYFTGEQKYADKAAVLLRTWFTDPETRMNPHLEYAQAVPGRSTGRGIGIIDIRGVYDLVDAIVLVERSGALKNEEATRIRQWFTDLFQWLNTSKNGQDEDKEHNNHSVAMDATLCAIAHFLGNDEYVIRRVDSIRTRRIDPMIEPDGRQPAELVRTRAFHYSIANLRNFFDAGSIGLDSGVDIFSYTNPQGGSLRQALTFLTGYIGRQEAWQWQEIGDWTAEENALGLLVRRAARRFENPEYRALWERVFADRMKTDWNLLVTP